MSSFNSVAAHPYLQALETGYQALDVSGSGVLLAVSGGADSLALLRGSAQLAMDLKLRLEVASVDHGFRSEAHRELDLVRRVATTLGLPFAARQLFLPGGAAVEERARTGRYRALEQIRAERSLDWIATGHTVEDQAETVLMRLTRGASSRGAAAILERQGRVIRPMLGATRAEVLRFLESLGQTFAVDPMNEDERYLRVRMRRRALPALADAAGPRAVLHLAQFARWAHEDDAFLTGLSVDALRRLEMPGGGLDRSGLRALARPLLRRVLADAIESAGGGVNAATLSRALQATAQGTTMTLNHGLTLSGAGDRVRIFAPAAQAMPAAELSPDSPVTDGVSGLTFSVEVSRSEEGLRLDQGVCFPLQIRSRRPGDRLPSRSGGRGRKLQDLLVNKKIAREQRDKIRIVTDRDGTLLWVVGVWKNQPGHPGDLCVIARSRSEPSGQPEASL